MSSRIFASVGRFAIRHRRSVMVMWVAVVVAAAALGLRLPARLGSGGFEVPGSQSQGVAHALQSDFVGQAAEPGVVTISAPGAPPAHSGQPSLSAVVAEVSHRLSSVRGVDAVQVMPLRARHTGQALLEVAIVGDQSDQIVTASRMNAVVNRALPSGFRAEVGGRAALYNSVDRVSRSDLERAELVSFPITLTVLLLIFGSCLAAGLPLVLAGVALVTTLGLLYLLSLVSALSAYVTNTASIIGIGVAIDYSLFVVTRFREERQHGSQVDDAVIEAISHAGRAVVISALTVSVAMAAMFVVDIQGFRSMADGIIIVVTVAAAAAVTLLPALLSFFGARIAPVRPRRRGLVTDAGWRRGTARVMRRPVFYLGVSVAVLTILALPLGQLHLGQPSAQTLPAGTPPRVALGHIAAEYSPGLTGPIEIVVPTPGGPYRPDAQARLAVLNRLLQRDARVQLVIGPPPTPGPPARGIQQQNVEAGFVSRNGQAVHVTVVGRDLPQSNAGQALIQRIRHQVAVTPGLEHTQVGGAGAADLDLTSTLAKDTPWVIAVALSLSFLLLLVSLQAPLLALKAVLMNLLSVGAAYGAVVAIFQWGWLSSVLRFHPEGQIQAFIPLFLFCILFGLSMDYEVFILARIREEYGRTGHNEQAITTGLGRTATTVTSAALIMVTVFGAFAGNRLLAFKAIGVGLAIAVLLDATVVRMVCVPAVMKLMGTANWWAPQWSRRHFPSALVVAPPEEEKRPDPVGSYPHPGGLVHSTDVNYRTEVTP
jgi:RND superfamily putative drug exporter